MMLRLQHRGLSCIIKSGDTIMVIENEKVMNSPLFSGIQAEEMGCLLGCIGGYVKTFPKGSYIASEEDNIRNIGIVLSGTVHMIKEDIWGSKTIISRIAEGGLFGETFVCANDHNSSVSFLAADNTEIIFLPFHRVMTTCSHSCGFQHQLVENMVVLLADKNRSLMEKIEVVSKKSLREKILSYLSLEAQKHDSKYFDIPLGRVEMADYLCIDRSALTRELNNMKKNGLLDFDKNTFHLY